MKNAKTQSNGSEGSKIKYVSVHVLKAPEYREKDHLSDNIEQVTKNIEQHGVQKPIVINTRKGRKGTILDGVIVVEICKSLGIDEVPVYEVDVDFDTEKELHFSLNNPASEFAEGQIQKLLGKAYSGYFPELPAVTSALNEQSFDAIEHEIEQHRAERPRLKKVVANLNPDELANFTLIKERLELFKDSDVIKTLIIYLIESEGL